MKDLLKIMLISFVALFFATCNDGDEKIEYFLSQPKDADLVGWWKFPYNEESDIQSFWQFKQTGTTTTLTFQEGKVDNYEEDVYYWYTGKKGDKIILYTFRKGSLIYAHEEYREYYKIVNDSLWTSEGIEGDKYNSPDLSFFGTKTEAPEGYE
jgi:hypothetical protein